MQRAEDLAYILLEEPYFQYHLPTIRSISRFKLSDDEIKAVMKVLVDPTFLRQARQHYEAVQKHEPSPMAERALRRIKALEQEPTVRGGETMSDRVPQPFVEEGLPLNARYPEGLPLKFDRFGDNWLRWQGRLGEHTVKVTVTGVMLARTVLSVSFLRSEAFLSRVPTKRKLPYAGADVTRRTGRVWWMATFDDGPVTLEVKNIIGLTQRQLEDGLNDSIARVEAIPLGYGRLPQTGRKPREMPQEPICMVCAGPLVSMGRLGRKEWFRCRNCGMEQYREAKGRAPMTMHPYATPARKLMDELEKLWKAGDTEEFYRRLDTVKGAIKERERGKIKKLSEISLGELRDIKSQADRLYR